MVRGKCALGRGLGPSPQESVSVLLSKHIHLSVSTGRQELSQCHYFKLPLGKLLGRNLECLGEKLPPSRLNPADAGMVHYISETTGSCMEKPTGTKSPGTRRGIHDIVPTWSTCSLTTA